MFSVVAIIHESLSPFTTDFYKRNDVEELSINESNLLYKRASISHRLGVFAPDILSCLKIPYVGL